MKTQHNRQSNFSVKNQPNKQSGFFLAMPVAGLALILGLGGSVVATHEKGISSEAKIVETTVLRRSEISALEMRPVNYQANEFDNDYFGTDG